MYFYQNKKGFTLVEIIVSLAVFMIVAMVALSALVRIISANRKAQALQESITDLNFTLEAMSREMRVGKDFSCTLGSNPYFSFSSNTSPKTACGLTSDDMIIAFASAYEAKNGNFSCSTPHNQAMAYRFYLKEGGGWGIQKAKEDNCSGISLSDFQDVLSPSLSITKFNGSVIYNNGIPMAFVRLSGDAGIKQKEKTFFDIQTSVSSRFTK